MLKELQHDGRIRDAVLAPRVSLSPSACHRHRDHLAERGVIKGYAVVLDERRLGYAENVLVGVRLSSQRHEDIEAFKEAVTDIEEVRECYPIFGKPDFMLRVVAEDTEHYEHILSERLACLPAVAHLRSYVTAPKLEVKKPLPVPRSHWK